MNLRNFDLNLLVVVDVVLAELSITRAAQRLNLTQPAVSQAMARARDVFDDELLVREGSSMRLTPLARRLAPELRDFCAAAERLLSRPTFDPSTAEMNFSVLANDLTELLIIPQLVAAVDRTAPGCRLVVRTPQPHLMDETIDLAIIGAPVPKGPFLSRDLYEEHFVVIARPGHPAMREDISAEDYAGMQHALVSPTGQGVTGPVDGALKQLGLTRRIGLSVTRFTTLPSIVSSTDLIAAIPSRFAERPEVHSLCKVWSLPFESPRFTMKLVWHRSHDADPAHVWLRGLL
ncbi:LysR family transcriptional regulator [Hyphomicrobium sp. 1Nfss2.1]|uniref:LysR family transcriptional regulator n=1 Tax=Hyphomicrobium sp. 1Nfss2.1 TaxID=3413936 RepID=UPI003C7C98F0